jgi:hypothetical protein
MLLRGIGRVLSGGLLLAVAASASCQPEPTVVPGGPVGEFPWSVAPPAPPPAPYGTVPAPFLPGAAPVGVAPGCHDVRAWGPFIAPWLVEGAPPSDLKPKGGAVRSGVYILVQARVYGPDPKGLQVPPIRSAKRVTGDRVDEWFETAGQPVSAYSDRFVVWTDTMSWTTQCPVQQAGATGSHAYTAEGDLLTLFKVDPAKPQYEQVLFYRLAY